MGPTPPDLPPEPDRKMPTWAIVLLSVLGFLVLVFGVCIALISSSF
jgi:hypothetical protein